jgi:hypothetical protein
VQELFWFLVALVKLVGEVLVALRATMAKKATTKDEITRAEQEVIDLPKRYQ